MIRARVTTAHDFISSKWKETHENTTANINTANLKNLRPDHNFDTYFPNLDTFLSAVASRQSNAGLGTFSPTSDYPYFPAAELPSGLSVSDEYTCFRLVAMEKWVEEHLVS